MIGLASKKQGMIKLFSIKRNGSLREQGMGYRNRAFFWDWHLHNTSFGVKF